MPKIRDVRSGEPGYYMLREHGKGTTGGPSPYFLRPKWSESLVKLMRVRSGESYDRGHNHTTTDVTYCSHITYRFLQGSMWQHFLRAGGFPWN